MAIARRGRLTGLHEYRAEILARIHPLEPLELALLEALGCVLADDVTTDAPVPRMTRATADGFAVVAGLVRPDAEMRIIGAASAGDRTDEEVGAGEAVRVASGAPIPAGADAVIPHGAATERGDRVTVAQVPSPDAYVRPTGAEFAAGQTVVGAGRRLGAPDLGMLAAVGRADVMVHPRPRVVVLSTGDEVVEPGAPLGRDQLYDANSYALTAAAREAGATGYRRPIVPDDPAQVRDAFEGALLNADLIVVTGGTSDGPDDHVRQVMSELGDVAIRRVGIEPGSSQLFGFLGEGEHPVPAFGLPGDPVSAFVAFEIFVRPALRVMQGRTDVNRTRVTAVLDEPVSSAADHVSFERVRLERRDDGWHAVPTGGRQGTSLASVVAAHGLAEVPADRTDVTPGEQVIVHLLVEAT